MTQIVESLFGVSPERYQEQKDAALQQEALAYAKLDPYERATAGIYAGARGLASGIGRMLGGEDPGMRRVTEQDQIIRSIDLNDPETYGPAAQRASQMGHTELAMKILQASDAAFQRRESQNMDEAFRVYGGAPARSAAPASIAPAPAPVAMAPAPAKPIVKIGDPYLLRSIIQNPERREDQVPAGQMEQKFVTQADLDLIKNYTGPQVQLLSDLTTPAAPAPVASAMAPQVPLSVAPAIGLEGKVEKLINDRRIFASQRPTKPGDVNRVNNTIKGIDEEIKRLTELNSPLAKLIKDRDKLPAGDPRIAIYDNAIKKESQYADKEITPPAVGVDRTAIAQELYDKTFDKLTPAQRAVVNKRVEEEQAKKAPKIEVKNVMPGDKNLADIPAFRASVQRTIEPQLKTITATEQALTAIDDSLATSNFAAYRAAQVQFARAISGAGDLSQKELKAAGADPSLLGGTADYLSTVFSSTPTADTQKKIRSTLQAIQTVARRQAQGEVNQQKAMALRSPGYNPDAVNEALKFPQLQAEATARAPIYAVNPDTKARIMSTDGGSTWSPVR